MFSYHLKIYVYIVIVLILLHFYNIFVFQYDLCVSDLQFNICKKKIKITYIGHISYTKTIVLFTILNKLIWNWLLEKGCFKIINNNEYKTFLC